MGQDLALYWFDEHQLLAVTSAGIARLGRKTPAELPSCQLSELVHSDDRSLISSDTPRSPSRTEPLRLRLLGANGELVPVEAEWLGLGPGRTRGLVCVGKAMTPATLEPEPRHLERLATLGMVAAGVVHEVNNPLGYLLLSLDQIAVGLRGLNGDGEIHHRLLERVADAREGVQHITEVIKEVRALARGETCQLGAVNVREALGQSIRVTAHAMRQRARVVLELDDSPFVHAGVTQLEQVFINLLLNAVHAIPRSSAIGQIRVVLRAVRPGWVAIDVTDNGEGIAPAHLGRIFEPFFTTKRNGLGTGLGLTIARNIVHSLGGRIRATSVEGKGATFRVELPACERPVEPPPTSGPRARSASSCSPCGPEALAWVD
ncbi:sensor histidine kinase [Myxococcota bacterium]